MTCRSLPFRVVTFTLDCPACFELSGDGCIHRQRYGAAEEYIKKKGAPIHLVVVDGCRHEPEPVGWWKGGQMITTPGILNSPDRYDIWMYPTSCRYWGWDMLTAILIHEFGHALLQVEKVRCGDIREEERQANKYGHDNMPLELIPEQYWAYREFCLQSYQSNYTEERLRSALRKHRSFS
jgi:hypothetical protein